MSVDLPDEDSRISDTELDATSDTERDATSDATPDAETAVADALSVIDGLEDLPPAEHVGRFEHVHDVLRAQLSGDA